MSADSEEPYGVVLTSEPRRYLHSLSPRISAAIVEFLTTALPQNPARLSKPLRAPFEGLRSARRGDYRVLFELHESSHRIVVIRIRHRSDAYRR